MVYILKRCNVTPGYELNGKETRLRWEQYVEGTRASLSLGTASVILWGAPVVRAHSTVLHDDAYLALKGLLVSTFVAGNFNIRLPWTIVSVALPRLSICVEACRQRLVSIFPKKNLGCIFVPSLDLRNWFCDSKNRRRLVHPPCSRLATYTMTLWCS